MGYKKIESSLAPGWYFMQGNEALAEGAIAAGCRFFAGYPITPSSEIMDRIVYRFAQIGGKFIQMEDELSSIGAVIGASWTGTKAMTATSGPGFSLMMENLGYAVFTETPCVIVDIQRAGPSTGMATRVAAGDLMQAKWGTHGDCQLIALSPWSVQEMYDLAIRAFNLSERFRVPVIILGDEAVGHLRESLEIKGELTVYDRDKSPGQPPFDTPEEDGVPPMPSLGEGESIIVTGSTHDGFGFKKTGKGEVHEKLVRRLSNKIINRADQIWDIDSHYLDDAEVVVISYGIVARSALRAVKDLREEGKKVGLLRLNTIWPFPDLPIKEVSLRCEKLLVPEMNLGQVIREIQRLVSRSDVVVQSLTQVDGNPIFPQKIAEAIEGLLHE
jgi:2-oxoglutarate ferredoxin oxidoreductase subunit alpha